MPALPEGLLPYLLWNDIGKACDVAKQDGTSVWDMFDWLEFPAVWRAIESEAVEEWVQDYPGMRPQSWWFWSAPELQRLEGGTYRLSDGRDRCHETGIPYITSYQENPPMVESTPPSCVDAMPISIDSACGFLASASASIRKHSRPSVFAGRICV